MPADEDAEELCEEGSDAGGSEMSGSSVLSEELSDVLLVEIGISELLSALTEVLSDELPVL